MDAYRAHKITLAKQSFSKLLMVLTSLKVHVDWRHVWSLAAIGIGVWVEAWPLI